MMHGQKNIKLLNLYSDSMIIFSGIMLLDIYLLLMLLLCLSPWRWANKWPKHVGGYPVIKLYNNTLVHFWYLYCTLIFSTVIYILRKYPVTTGIKHDRRILSHRYIRHAFDDDKCYATRCDVVLMWNCRTNILASFCSFAAVLDCGYV